MTFRSATCAFALLALQAGEPTPARAELTLQIDSGDIDLQNRTIYFRLGTRARSAELQLFSPEGALLHRGEQSYPEPEPGTRLHIGWPDLGKAGENFRIELKFTDTSGNWVTFQVVRFYLEIPHEDVAFASGKWDISPEEQKKLVTPLALLKDAAAKYAKEIDVQLFVAGHTDTVGKAEDNQALSEKRARAIARYFVEGGLTTIPVFVRGFGEGSPARKTADNVAEAANRRAQYIVSSFTPELPGPGSWTKLE